MIRRLILFVLIPLALSYCLAQLAISLGVRTAGLHWLTTVAYFLFFGLPGLAVVTTLGRGQRRDFVEMAGLLCAMGVGAAFWAGLSYGRWFYVVESDGPRRYTFVEAAALGLRDAALDTGLAAVVLGLVLVSARLLQARPWKSRGNVR
jgi:hypothetical protein